MVITELIELKRVGALLGFTDDHTGRRQELRPGTWVHTKFALRGVPFQNLIGGMVDDRVS